MASIHLEVRGRVQGVGFRWYVLEKARELGLRGWVKNRSDGNLELAAAGDPAAVGKLVDAVGEGPRGATIEEVRELDTISSDTLGSAFVIVR